MAYELYGAGGQAVQDKLTTFEKRLLQRFRAETIYNKWGKKGSIPGRGGRRISFRRLENIFPAGDAGAAAEGSAPAALTEGTPGAEINATWSEVIATIAQYGQHLKISDLAMEQDLDDQLAEFTEAFGESMRDALDLLTRDVLVGGTTVQYASIAATRGGASGVASGMYLNLAELRESKRTLKGAGNNARPVRSEGGKFVVVTHPDAMYDLEADADIVNVWQHAGDRGMSNQLFDTAFKDLPGGFRVYETSNSRIFADAGRSTADVYASLVFGEEWYGTVTLEKLPAKMIYHARGTSGVVDPLDQVASIGWKAPHAAVILNQNLGVRIEHVTSTNNMG